MAGRRPKPTALKKLQGNPGHRPLNDAEPEPLIGIPEMPKGMWPAARREWHRIAPVLLEIGVLTIADGKALAAYCEAYALWEKARQSIDEYGLVVVDKYKDKDGTEHESLKANPAIAIRASAAKEMKSFLIEFGLTPASRAKLKISTKPKEKDPMDEYMKGKQGEQDKHEASFEELAAETDTKVM
jgi:P27 family predicted phage terminase small subunit